LLLPVLIRRSIRHIEGKVREIFGSRNPKDADFDSKLRPKDSAQMDNRVRMFVECKEQWHMLRKRAVLESHISVSSSKTQADIFDTSLDDQQALFVRQQENPPDEAFQAEIQSLSTSTQEYPDSLDWYFFEADTDVSMGETGGLGKLDLGSSSSLPLGGRHPSFDIDPLDTSLPDNNFEWSFSADHKVHEETLLRTLDVLEGNRSTLNPVMNFDNFSYGSFSSSGYEGSPASARDRRRARNREAQRLYRMYHFDCFAHVVLTLDYSQDNERRRGLS
jgi:hypothetical protein